MSKIQITLDADKLRPLIKNREYTNRNGETVTVREVKAELVPLKEENQKVVHSTDKYNLVKTHFVSAIQTKEERERKDPTVYVGEGFITVWKDNAPSQTADDDIPF